jgi:hypothetical protein
MQVLYELHHHSPTPGYPQGVPLPYTPPPRRPTARVGPTIYAPSPLPGRRAGSSMARQVNSSQQIVRVLEESLDFL